MNAEQHTADDIIELVWLRLNSLKSSRLCENLIRNKIELAGTHPPSDDVLRNKAIGLSSAIESGLGFWKGQNGELNARVLSRYYFLLQMTIAEQVSSLDNSYGLEEIQRHTKFGHGLKVIEKPQINDIDDMFVCQMKSGYFAQYIKSLKFKASECAFDTSPKEWHKLNQDEKNKCVSIADIFRRIPELSAVVEEHLNKPPLSFRIFYSSINQGRFMKEFEPMFNEMSDKPRPENFRLSIMEIYPQSRNVNLEYLNHLHLPISDLRVKTNFKTRQEYYEGDLIHHQGTLWHEELSTYSSSYAPVSYALPLWGTPYNSTIANFALLYSLSIIVRYMPNLWFQIRSGSLNHIGSLIEYYISVIDHILPLQMLEKITGTKINIESKGSLYGES